MRPAFPWLLALLGLCTLAQADPRELIGECAPRIPAGVDGLEALEPLCPGLTQALSDLSNGAPLAAKSLERLNQHSLNDFLRLTAAPEVPAIAPLDPAAARTILQQFGVDHAHQLSWWDRFTAWCKKWLLPAKGSSRSLWLPEWLQKLIPSATVAKAVFYTLLGLIVLGVIYLVRNELRAAGLFQRNKASREGARPSFASSVTVGLSLEQILKSPPAQRPRLLFALMVNELMRQGRLQQAASLTHREVAERARLADATERARLSDLSRLAECQLYGGNPTESSQSESVFSEAQALYVRLRRQPQGET